jgi:hypothetical protein
LVVGNPAFAPFGAVSLTVTGTSKANSAVTATLNLAVIVPYALGVSTRFQPSSQNTPAIFPLYVQNTGSVEDTYSAMIVTTSGNVQASLIDLDGTATQQTSQFALPGLATGQLYLNVTGTAARVSYGDCLVVQ